MTASGASRCGGTRVRWFMILLPVLLLAYAWSGVLQASPLESRPMVGREMVRQQGWHRVNFWQVLREEAENLRSMGMHREVASVLARADELLRKEKGVRQSTILRNELEMIHALIRVGDPEGEKKVNDFLATWQKSLGQDNPEVLYARHLLTSCMIARWDMTGAETLLKDVIERRAKVLGAGHPDTLASRSNLAFTLSSQLEHPEADTQLRLVLAAEEALYGEGHPQPCMTRRLLAKSLALQAKFPEALQEYQVALAGLTKAYGPRHTLVLKAGYDFAVTRYRTDAKEQAEAELKYLTNTITAVAGADSPETIPFRKAWADCLAVRGFVWTAEMHYREILRVLNVSGPTESFNQADCQAALRLLLNHRVPIDSIGMGLVDDLAWRRQRLGPDHRATLNAMQALVWWRRGKGHFRESEAEAREMVEANERVYGPDDWVTWFARNSLADVLNECGKNEEAAALQRRMIAYLEKKTGPAAPFTLNAQARLAGTIWSMGRLDESRTLTKSFFPKLLQTYGERARETFLTQERIASTSFETGHYDEAEKLYKYLCDEAPKMPWQEAAFTAEVHCGYARLLLVKKRPVEAEKIVQRGRQLIGASGQKSKDAILLQTHLVLVFLQQGRFKEAAAYALECQRFLRKERGGLGPTAIMLSNALTSAMLGSGRFQDALIQAEFGNVLCVEIGALKDGPSSVRSKCAHAMALRYLNKTAEWQELASELEVQLPNVYRSGEPILLFPKMLAREGTPPFHGLVNALLYSKLRQDARDNRLETLENREFPVNATDPVREELMGIYFQAQDLAARGEHLAACEKFQEFVQKGEPLAGDDTMPVSDVYVRAAVEAVRAGREDLAHEMFSKIMDLALETPPNRGRRAGDPIVQFAHYLAGTGDIQHARTCAEIAMAATSQRLGEAHPLSISALYAMGGSLKEAGMPEEGDLMKKHAAIAERAFGPTNLETIEAKLAVLHWHVGRKDYNEILAVAGELRGTMEKVFGPGSSEVVSIREAMVEALHGQGLTSVALSEYRLILRDVEAAYGEDSLNTLTLRHRLALAVQRTSHLEEAVELHRRNAAILTQLGGERNTITVEVWLNEALALITLNRHREAIEPATKALKYGSELLGENHELMKQAQVLLKAAQQGGKGG